MLSIKAWCLYIHVLNVIWTGPVVEVDEADDSISDDEEPAEQQVPTQTTSESAKLTTPPAPAETSKPEEQENKTEEETKEKSDVKQEDSKPEGIEVKVNKSHLQNGHHLAKLMLLVIKLLF